MSLSRQEAFSILDVPRGSSEDHIRSAYKKLALKWHPDKHANSDEATKKFQDISAAYKRLTTEDDHADVILTPEDMFDLFAQMFFAQRTSFRAYNGFNFGRDSTDEDEIEDESDDDDDDCDFTFRENIRFSYPFPPNPSSSSKKNKPTVYSYTARRPTASEASKNAEELMKEEERQRKQREKKKAKKKRQKDKKKLEKEKKEQEAEDKKKLAAEKKKEEEEEEACPGLEQVESSSASESESDSEDSKADEENIVTQIKVDTSNKTSNNKNSSSKSKSSNNNLLNGHMTGHGDATRNKMSTSTTNSDKKASSTNGIDKKSAATNGMDKKSAATTNDKKTSSTTTEKKTTPIKKTKKEPSHNHIASSSDSDSDQEETTGLDPTSAFFAHAAAAASKKINSQPHVQPKPKKEKEDKNKINGKKKSEDADSIEDMDPVILRSRQSAVKGNEMANLGHYSAAVELFSQAIQLNPRDFRFFGNRSFCYDRLDKFDKALKDAEKAISLAKDWPKGHFRKGRALSGLRRYADAENAFEQVLRLDKNCEEAVEELRRVRGYQLMEMGFTRQQSEAAIRQYGSVQAALEVLLIQGAPGEVSSQAFDEDVYLSDDEDYITETIEQSKTDVENPEGLRSLWIGNVQPTVSEKELRDLFGKFGELQSVRRLNDKFCCFINFKRASQAATAMSQLQGQHLHGRLLLIKFPDNPIIEGQPRITVLKKTQQQPQQQQTKQSKQQQKQQQAPTPKQTQQVYDSQQNQDKMSGPVNGDECYFWRTTGCAFGDGCKHKHIKGNKGVDRKPWQKNLYKN